MKKIISLSFALFLLISSTILMTSCDVATEEASEDSYSNESVTPSETESETEPETEPPVGRAYGDYQVITVTDEATVELVENMWKDDSWYHLGSASTFDLKYFYFEKYVLPENIYLQEILEREDGIDLLIWAYDGFADYYENRDENFSSVLIKKYGVGYDFLYCMKSNIIQSRMTEAQKYATMQIFERCVDAR